MTGSEVGWLQWLIFALPLACVYEVFIFGIFVFLYCRGPKKYLNAALNLQVLGRRGEGRGWPGFDWDSSANNCE